MRTVMLVTIPEGVEAEPYIKGFINGLVSFYPIPVQEVVMLDEIPQYLKDKAEGSTFSERDGKTYVKIGCERHNHPELEVKVLEVTTIPLRSPDKPDMSKQMPMMFNGDPPKMYEA